MSHRASLTRHFALFCQVHGPKDAEDVPGSGGSAGVGQAGVVQGRGSGPGVAVAGGGHRAAAAGGPPLPQQRAGLVHQGEGLAHAARAAAEGGVKGVVLSQAVRSPVESGMNGLSVMLYALLLRVE